MRYTLLLIISFFISNHVTAQSYEQQKDSLINLINNEKEDEKKLGNYLTLGYKEMYQEPLEAIKTAHFAINLSKKLNNEGAISEFYTLLLSTHLYYGSPSDTLLKYIQELEVHANNTEKVGSGLLNTYWFYALYYNNTQQLDKELEAYIKALEIQRKYFKSSAGEAGLLSNIGGCFEKQGKHTEALDYYNKALELTNDDIGQGTIYQSIGNIKDNLNKHDEALEYYQRAYEYNKKGGDFKGMAVAKMSEGFYYDRQQQYERSNQMYFEALQLINDNDIGTLLPSIYITLATHFQSQKRFNAAISYGEKALIEILQQQNYEELSNTYNLLQDSYAAIGDFKKAFEIRGQQMAFQDSVSNANLSLRVEALQTEFKVEQKEIENELLKAEQEVTQKTLRSRTAIAIGLIAVLLLVGGWSFFIYRNSQQRKRYNQILEDRVKERTKDLEQANYELRTMNYIASHDIKEPIRVISGYVSLIKRKLSLQEQEGLSEYFDTIKRSTSQLYTIIEDFAYYSTLSKNDEIKTEPVDLNLLTYNVIDNLQESIVKYKGEVLINNLPTINSSNTFLFTALKNLIENGLKYNKSETPTVEITYNETETHHQIIVSDNGIGIDKKYHEKIFEMFKRLHNRGAYEGSGIGLAIVKLVTEKLGGTVEIKSEVGKGTSFILLLPR